METLEQEQNAIANVIISKVLAEEIPETYKAEFFDNIITFIEQESQALKTDKERYLEFLNGVTIMSRACSMDFSGNINEVYQKANAPESPIRNGMILFGLYQSSR